MCIYTYICIYKEYADINLNVVFDHEFALSPNHCTFTQYKVSHSTK